MRYQGVDSNGETLSSFYVQRDTESGDPTVTQPGGPSLTRQEFADECDINTIMAQYEVNGVLSHLAQGTPQYLDVSDVPDLAQAMAVLEQAERAFMTLSANVRREFDNDPRLFVEYCQDPDNLEQMRAWGLAAPKKLPDPPIRVEVIPGAPVAENAPAPSPAPTNR